MTFTPRTLDEFTLQGAAEHYVKEFNRASVPNAHVPGAWIGGRSYVMRNLVNGTSTSTS